MLGVELEDHPPACNKAFLHRTDGSSRNRRRLESRRVESNRQ